MPLGNSKMTAVGTLGHWCAALSWSAIPAAQRVLVPLRVLDTLGLVLAGADVEAARTAADYARSQGGITAATLFADRGRLPAALVALAHGVAAHCRDFDDTFPDSVVHPGSLVVAAALAMGEAARAAPEDIGCAILAGYEVAARLGAVAGRRFHARGLHATAVVGPIAAPVDLRPRRVPFRLEGVPADPAGWAVVVDPGDLVPELYEGNNRARLGLGDRAGH